MEIIATSDGVLDLAGRRLRCALGRGGVDDDKREGDGKTPAGIWPLRRVLFRPDRLSQPPGRLPTTPLQPFDGWCDDPADPLHYNRQVRLPRAGGHERLWRADAVYDVIVVLGYNDQPAEPGRGSAIFLHVARPDYAPTDGCVALALPHLLDLLRHADAGDSLRIDR